jgi:hypothetical protein
MNPCRDNAALGPIRGPLPKARPFPGSVLFLIELRNLMC